MPVADISEHLSNSLSQSQLLQLQGFLSATFFVLWSPLL